MITREIVENQHPIKLLGEVATFLDHRRRPVKQSERTEGPYPYYGANGLQGTIDGYIFDEPLILLAEDGGHFDDPDRGIAYEISGRTWVNNHAHVLKPSNGTLDLKYLRRVLENYDVRPFINGSTRSKLTKAQAERIPIPFPPLEEQRRIAAILDKADALRRKRKRALELLDTLTQSIFLDMFGHNSDEIARWGDPVALGDIADIGSGITKGRKSNGQATREIPYLAVVNVQDRRLNLSSVKTIEATEDEILRYRLQKDDLLLTEGGDPDKLGRGTLWAGEIGEAIHQNHIFRVRLKSEVVLPLFLNWLISSPYGKRYFLSVAKQTTGIASINKTQLSEFPTIVPSIDLQSKYVRLAQAIAADTRRLVSSEQRADFLFASLQHRAFSGQL